MVPNSKVLLVDGDSPRTAAVARRLVERGVPHSVRPLHALADAPSGEMAVLVLASQLSDEQLGGLERFVGQLAEQKVAGLVWGQAAFANKPANALLDMLDADVSLDEVVGRLQSITRYAPILRRMDRELRHMQMLSQQLTRYFSEVDQEMRLAGRLQRDFLPAEVPQAPPYTIATLYRPASFVSGDTYDAELIDDRHLALFLADAMGHGVAAGLITMFMQQALVHRERRPNGEMRIVPAAQVLSRLHQCLERQQLPNSQFVTGVYMVLDRETGAVRFSRAGHPYPVHVSAAGELREVEAEGGLLGLPGVDPECQEGSFELKPGDKLILYTDGVEDVLLRDGGADDSDRFSTQFHAWAHLGAHELVETIANHLDRREGSLNPTDDATILVLEHAG